MTQRLVAAFLAVPTIVALLVFVGTQKLYFATYSPGGTLDVLGTAVRSDGTDAGDVIQVAGHPVYRDDGELRMTTVAVSQAADIGETPGLSLYELMSDWLDRDRAVLPYDAVHGPEETPETSRQEGAEQMATSQDSAIEVALREMGIDVPQVLKVAGVTDGLPADGKLAVGDILRSVDGERIEDDRALVTAIRSKPAGTALRIGIERMGEPRTVTVRSVPADGVPVIGIQPGYDYDFPFDVSINIDPNIGGPSAGLIFSLAVYDTLTPGSLTGGRDVAGTGEIAPDGRVGPIGGIQQKIAGARDDGADLFLVPIDNCADALAADNSGDMRLMMATTMHDVRLALEKYAQDPDADLPSCADADAVRAAS